MAGLAAGVSARLAPAATSTAADAIVGLIWWMQSRGEDTQSWKQWQGSWRAHEAESTGAFRSSEAQSTKQWQGSWRAHEAAESTGAFRSSGNNHDHLKHKHPTKEEAEREIRRMQAVGKDGCERLKNAYYNDDLDGWFVGNGNAGDHVPDEWRNQV
jgi:hypothetical protein